MPGPNSAPNGDKSLVSDKDNQNRQELARKGKLVTGKTQKSK